MGGKGGHTGARLLISAGISLGGTALSSWLVKNIDLAWGIVLIFGINFTIITATAYTMPHHGPRNVKFGRLVIKALVFTIFIEIGLYALLTYLINGGHPFYSVVDGRSTVDLLDMITYVAVWLMMSMILAAGTVIAVH
jgi:hypothetical protein